MEKHNLVFFRTKDRMTWVKCDEVYVNDVCTANRWYDAHDDVDTVSFKNGVMYFDMDGDNIVSIYDCEKISIVRMGDETVWFIE